MEELFLFLDLETTGLDPKQCRIVEVACALTKTDFVPFATFESLNLDVNTSPRDPTWEHVAYQMHYTSGVVSEIRTGQDAWRMKGEYVAPAQEMLHAFLSKHLGMKRANLAGNSVHFDRRFLEEHWPAILPFLTHRQLDVSSLRLAGMAKGREKFKGEAAHRAMADVKASLAELAYWMGA